MSFSPHCSIGSGHAQSWSAQLPRMRDCRWVNYSQRHHPPLEFHRLAVRPLGFRVARAARNRRHWTRRLVVIASLVPKQQAH
jgi:hypothetical protein